MSTKAIHEALDWLENNPTAEEAQDARRRAREEGEAIERASKALAKPRLLPAWNTPEVHEAISVLESIAKAAP